MHPSKYIIPIYNKMQMTSWMDSPTEGYNDDHLESIHPKPLGLPLSFMVTTQNKINGRT